MTDRATSYSTEIIEEDTQGGKYLAFRVDEEKYGLEIRCVTELIRIMPVTPLPACPPDIQGILSLRGQIIPVMDIRIRFGKPPHEATGKSCIIILEVGGNPIGVLVDQVEEVLNIPEDSISPPPDRVDGNHSYIQGIARAGDHVILILDCERLTA